MTRKPKEEPDVESEIEAETEEIIEADPRQSDTPFDPWGVEEEESDRRRDPLRSPVA